MYYSNASDVALVSMETGRILSTFECCPPLWVCDNACFSPDGRILATDTFAFNGHDQPVLPILKLWRIPASW